MADGRKNVPFALPDEEEEDVFSSVDVERDDADVLTSSPPSYRTSQGLPAVTSNAAPSTAHPVAGSAPAPAAPRAARPRLTVEAANMSIARTVDVDRPAFLIGGEDADLALQDDFVSPFHALLRIENGAVYLQDTGSKNGVFLRIADDLQLEDHDEIVVGNQRLVFRTTWDPVLPPTNPYVEATPELGGNASGDAARLIHVYAGGNVAGVWRIRDHLTIGRSDADVVEPDDGWLSTPHATIERRGASFFIKDTHSQYGTFVRVAGSVELIDGDCFIIGRSRIKITYP